MPTSPSFLASSVISMNFWISEMVGPVKSSTGIIVCFRLKTFWSRLDKMAQTDYVDDNTWRILGIGVSRRDLLRTQGDKVVDALVHQEPHLGATL